MPAFSNVGDALSKEMGSSEPELSEEESERRYTGHQTKQTNNTCHLLERLIERRKFLEENVQKIILCQAVARKFMARKRYEKLVKQYREHQAKLAEKRQKQLEASVTRAQAYIRMQQQRKKYMEKRKHFKDNEDSIAKLQAAWKGRKMRQAYREKMGQIHDQERAWTKVVRHWIF